MNCGPATSAGPTHKSVIAGIIRKAQSNCMSPAEADYMQTNARRDRAQRNRMAVRRLAL